MKKFTILDTGYEHTVKERKHNRWIEGLESGEAFFRLIGTVGYALLGLMCVLTAITFWAQFSIDNYGTSFFDTGVLMIKILRLGVWMLLLGVICSWLCYLLSKILYQKELNIIKQEGVKRYVNRKKRKSNKRVH